MKSGPGNAPGGVQAPVEVPALEPWTQRYRTFLALTGDGIARFELDPPLCVDDPEDEQVERILKDSRIAECNQVFARLYGRDAAEMMGQLIGDFIPSDDPARLKGIREFIQARYRLVYSEEAHALDEGSTRWVGGSALGAIEEGFLHGYWLCIRDITERKRAEADRERGERILEAVAFSAARLLQAGTWREQAVEVLARLCGAAQAARAWIAENEPEPDGSSRFVFRFQWTIPGQGISLDDPRIRAGVPVREAGLERVIAELQAGRPVATRVRDLPEAERSFPSGLETKSFAAVPIFVSGKWWGFLGEDETRYEREWSAPEVEALKAAAAVLGAAIERERADEALRESEERFKRLSAAAFEGIAITEAGRFVDANEQLAGMLGGAVADLIGRPVQEFVAPEDLSIVEGHLEARSEGPYQHRAQRRDGSLLPVEVRARSLPHRGRMLRVSAIHDVSERVRAEENQRRLEADLRLAADQWRQTFDALDLGLVLADPEARIVRLNRTALSVAEGTAFSDAVGRKLDELPDREPWRTMADLHRQVGERRISVVAEAREDSQGRSFYLLGSPWFRGEGEPPWRLLTFRDVTDFTNMQEQLRRARIMEAMGSLVAGVAHEVRNPLFSISATVDALEGEFGPRPEFADYSALLRSQVGRLTQLMRDLLDYGKPSLLRRAPTQLGDLLRRVARSCAPLARERQVRVEDTVAEDLPPLDVDGARLEQALENLATNAIQHAPAGSVVRIAGSLGPTSPEPLARCTVEDEGPGLESEDLTRIFEPFFSRRKGGTGLGLSIVQRVVEAHGGSVTAENREGGGARFTLLLPVGGGRPEGAQGV